MGEAERPRGNLRKPYPGKQFGVKYPSGRIVECPFGRDQAIQIWMLALKEFDREIDVVSRTKGGQWVIDYG